MSTRSTILTNFLHLLLIYEGFPKALIEAIYFGLACTLTNCPTGPSKLIRNGTNVYLLTRNDEIA